MKKFLSVTMIAALAVGLLSTGSFKAVAESVERGFVSVSTTANTELQPDVVEINIAVQTEDSKSLQKATEENKIISDKVYKALSSMINKENGDYIKTADFNASPMYSYKNSKRSLEKYLVSNNVIIHTKQIKDAGKMIDKAIELGATNVNNIYFSVSSYDDQCDELITLAAKKAYTRAGKLAATAGNSLNGIKSINGSCSTNNTNYQYRLLAKNVAMDSSASAGESSSPIQAGVVKLYANVNASYFVK